MWRGCGTRFPQDKDREQSHQNAHACHGIEQALPRVFQHNQVAEYRRQYRNNAGDTVKEGKHLRPAAIVEGIAQHRKGDDVAAARADPLNKAPSQEVGADLRLRAEKGGQYEDNGTENRHRLAP